LGDKLAEAVETSAAVVELRTMGLGANDDLVAGAEAPAGEAAKTPAGEVGEAADGGDGDMQLDLGVELVDGLPAGTAGADKAEAQLPRRDPDAGREDLGGRGWSG